MDKEPISLAVDVLIFRNNEFLLVKRRNNPFKGFWALPGGFVGNETVEEAARREAMEETNLEIYDLKLIGVYSEPKRDPRGRVVSCAFACKGRGKARAKSDAVDCKWFFKIPEKIAFDHKKIIKDGLKVISQSL